jgi:hypothetical protein
MATLARGNRGVRITGDPHAATGLTARLQRSRGETSIPTLLLTFSGVSADGGMVYFSVSVAMGEAFTSVSALAIGDDGITTTHQKD